MNLVAQHKHFIFECKTLDDLKRIEFKIWRIYDGKVSNELKTKIEDKRKELTKNTQK